MVAKCRQSEERVGDDRLGNSLMIALESRTFPRRLYCLQCGVKIGRNWANTEELGEVSHRSTDLRKIGVTDSNAPVPLREGTYGWTKSASNFFRNVQIVAKVHLIMFG